MGSFTQNFGSPGKTQLQQQQMTWTELGVYSLLAFQATMTLWNDMSCFSLLVDFERWIKRGFVQCFKETEVGEAEYIYVRRHGCSHRTEMRKPLLPPICCPITHLPELELLCDWNESDLQKEAAKCYFLFYTHSSLWVNALVVWYTLAQRSH